MNKYILLALFILGFVAAKADIFSIDPDGSVSASAIKIIYFIPAILAYAFLNFTVTFSRRNSDPEVKAEKIKSLIRTVIQIAGTILAFGSALNVQWPVLDKIRGALFFISENLDIAANAVITLIGIFITLYGYFKDSERFEARALKINGKKYDGL